MENFGATLKKARQEKGLTLLELATLSGVSESNIVRLEANAVKRPRCETLKLLAESLNLDLNEILEFFNYPV